jgi:hypothetical protein
MQERNATQLPMDVWTLKHVSTDYALELLRKKPVIAQLTAKSEPTATRPPQPTVPTDNAINKSNLDLLDAQMTSCALRLKDASTEPALTTTHKSLAHGLIPTLQITATISYAFLCKPAEDNAMDLLMILLSQI